MNENIEASMARALNWLAQQDAPDEYCGALQEAVAAYDPPEARTVCREQQPAGDGGRHVEVLRHLRELQPPNPEEHAALDAAIAATAQPGGVDLFDVARKVAKVADGEGDDDIATEVIDAILVAAYELEARRLSGQGDVERWIPVAERLPADNELVLVWTPADADDESRIDFDHVEDGCWMRHADDYDHFQMVAPPGSKGPQQEAPYTHWAPIPPRPFQQQDTPEQEDSR